MTVDLLDTSTAVAHLAQRGLIGTNRKVTVTELGGGISNVVLLAVAGEDRLIVKQSLPELKVADKWTATTERTIHEGRALELIGARWPGDVPKVRDLDEQRHILVIQAADPSWTNWKDVLMVGQVRPAIGTVLGDRLARWHSSIPAEEVLLAGLDDPQAFDQLRIDPYYRATAQALPGWTEVLNAHAADLGHRLCLVHGDFSPKNILVGPKSRCWVIDFEVAHLGNPVFDVAFLITHLVLKSVHNPGRALAFASTAYQFLSAYTSGTSRPAFSDKQLVGHVGCLLLARVAGKSPAEYLDADQRRTTLQLAEHLLTGGSQRVGDLWQHSALAPPPPGRNAAAQGRNNR